MKKIIILLAVIPAVHAGFCQTPTPDVKQLVVTSSPAYILLGVQPENIQRPSTPRDLIGGVQSAIVNGQLQPNFAMEFNPFNWNKKTKSNQFYANDYFYSGKEAVKKNFAVSLATSSSDTVVFGKLNQGLGVSYGLRVTLVPGKVNKITRDLFSEWEFEEVKSMFRNSLASFLLLDAAKTFTNAEIDFAFSNTTDAVKKKKDILQENKDVLIAKLKVFAETYKGLANAALTAKLAADGSTIADNKIAALTEINKRKVPFDRQGFTLEMALAGVTVVQENFWSQMHHGKTAVWITPAYRFNVAKDTDDDLTKSIDLMSVFRFIWNENPVDTADYFDFGAKFQYNKVKWNASFEATARHASKVPVNINSKWTYCWLFSFSYTMNEVTTLKFSFGSNFDGNTTTYSDPKKMFAVGGLNLSVFNNK